LKREQVKLEQVRAYWEAHPAGYDEIKHLEKDPLAFLEERDRRTRLTSPQIPEKYRMKLAAGLEVLDVGCGNGYNAQELVRHGAKLTGVDLTSKGLELVTQRFRLRNLKGQFVQANAEQLPFRSGSFDFIHSSGVLHHTPDIQQAVSELHRVLRPGGRGSVMVYHRNSLYYRYYIQCKLRLLMVSLYLLPAFLRERLLAIYPPLKFYVPAKFPRSQDFLNAGTDFGGAENPLSRVYSKKTARLLFSNFIIEGFATSQGAYKPFKQNKNWVERIVGLVRGFIMDRFGWYLFVYLRKA
jgi:ubiquinone/menaquinone biosynthesis C-methylase UbiE